MFGMPKLTPEMEQAVIEGVKREVPGITSQAQYNAFAAAFDAFRLTVNSIFTGDASQEAQGRDALEKAFDVCKKVTEITEKLREVPEAASGASASMFTQPPNQLLEYDIQKALLAELETIESLEELTDWYNSTPSKERREKLVSQSIRNAFFDAVRVKQKSFSMAE